MKKDQKRVLKIRELDLDIIRPCAKIAVIGKPGCLEKGTLVRMFDGSSKEVENIVPGDRLLGDCDEPRTVLSLCRGREKMVKIVHLDSSFQSFTVNRGHILTLVNQKGTFIDVSVESYMNSTSYEEDLFSAKLRYNNNQCTSPFRRNVIRIISSTREIPDNVFNMRWIDRKYVLYAISKRDNELFQVPKYKRCKELLDSLGLSYFDKDDSFFTRYDQWVLPYSTSKFKVFELDEDDYYGFTLDGNGRFLLSSGILTHNTGKSTIIESILFHKKHIYPVAQIYSGTEDSNASYEKFINSLFIFDEFNMGAVKDFVVRQKTAKKYLKYPDAVPMAVQVVDDCTDDPKIFTKPLLQKYYKNGRHWDMLHILSLQYSMDIRPVIRTNIDGVFILRENILRNRECLFKNYASAIGDFNDFCELMDKLTDDYTAIYINNQTSSNKIEDCLFYYRATKPPEGWKFGCEDFHLFAEQRYNPNYSKMFDA